MGPTCFRKLCLLLFHSGHCDEITDSMKYQDVATVEHVAGNACRNWMKSERDIGMNSPGQFESNPSAAWRAQKREKTWLSKHPSYLTPLGQPSWGTSNGTYHWSESQRCLRSQDHMVSVKHRRHASERSVMATRGACKNIGHSYFCNHAILALLSWGSLQA